MERLTPRDVVRDLGLADPFRERDYDGPALWSVTYEVSGRGYYTEHVMTRDMRHVPSLTALEELVDRYKDQEQLLSISEIKLIETVEDLSEHTASLDVVFKEQHYTRFPDFLARRYL